MQVKLVIDGVEVQLEPNGKSRNFEKFKEPNSAGNGDRPLIVSVYVKPGWKPKE